VNWIVTYLDKDWDLIGKAAVVRELFKNQTSEWH